MPGTASSFAEQGLQRIDRMAESTLRLIEPIRVEVARSPRELECAYRLRFRTALDHGWISPDQFPSGLEKDEYDEQALQIIAIEGGAVVGTTRIIFPAPDRRLPTEEAFAWLASGRVAEVGRVCRDPRSTSGLRIFHGLIGKAWIEMRKRGFSECCGVAALNMIAMYETLGFDVVKVAPPRLHWGEERWPVWIRPLQSSGRLQVTLVGE